MTRKIERKLEGVVLRAKFLFVVCCVLGSVFAAGQLNAQTPAPTPMEGKNIFSGYQITSSVEFGIRGLLFNGSDEKFRSDLNYRPGFRFGESNILIKASDGKGAIFDTLQVKTSGWGSDPSGVLRLGMEKGGAYRFDANVRKVNLINRVKNLTLGLHPSNTDRNFGDLDLTIFPDSETLRLRFGFSFNKAGGDRGSSYRTRDVFPMNERLNSNAFDFRQGLDTKVAGFKLTLNAGMRRFKDKGWFLIDSRQTGVAGSCFYGICISPTDVNFINRYEKSNPTDGDTNFGSFTVQRNFAKKVDLTGRFIYSGSKTTFDIRENVNYDGQIRLPTGTTSPALFVDADLYQIFGRSKRYQARGDIGVTWAVTDQVRLSNTFTFDQFTSFGDSDYNQQTTARVQSTRLPYLPSGVPSLDTRSVYWRQHNFKRFTNTVEGDVQVNNSVGFFVGYRYTHRKAGLGVRNATLNDLLNRPLTAPTFEEDVEENSANVVIFGTKIKPTNNWAIFADGEHGQADNAFIRLANYDYTNFRVRSIWNVKKFTFNLSGLIRNNENPSRTEDYRNAAGTILLPAFDIIANVRTRVFSAYVDYNPDPRWTLSSGYTYSYLTSKTDTVVPLSLNAANPPNPVGNLGFIRGFSEFQMRDNYFFVDISGSPIDRVSLYASYRYNHDKGQGRRAATLMEQFISSYPFTLHTPELRLAIRLTNNVDWNVGYQYNSYKERLQYGYFPYNELVNTNVIPANAVYPPNQNYNAHLPYMSLRIYFGGR
jgi:hypothetical protein